MRRLEAGRAGEIAETPKPREPLFDRVENVVIGNNALVTDAAVATARRLGFRTDLIKGELQGEAREVVQDFVARARTCRPRALSRPAAGATGDRREGEGGRAGSSRCRAAPSRPPPDRIPSSPPAPTGRRPDRRDGAIVDAPRQPRARRRQADARRALAKQ
jgi:hydroxypyruvate reductase